MFWKLALSLIMLTVLPVAASAAVTASPGNDLKAGRRTVVNYDTTGTLILDNECGTISVSHYAATAGVIEMYAMQDGSGAVTAGVLLATFSTTTGPAELIVTGNPKIGLNVTGDPTGTAKLMMFCAANAGGGGGSSNVAACTGDARCFILNDADVDGDYADDFQKQLNTLAYSDFATQFVNNEVVDDDASDYFGLLSSDTSAAGVYDPLVNDPINIQSGGSCSDGGSQVATIGVTGAITGDVTSAGDVLVDEDINCSGALCVSGISAVLFLYSPTDWSTLVCSRSGATNVVFTSPTTCTGSASLCTIDANGTLSINWSAGAGATTCSYTSRARNEVIWKANDATNGRLSARWAAPPTGTTTCDYTYVTVADGGIDAADITVAPPTSPATLEWKSTVNFCRNWNSNTPTGYTVPSCDVTTNGESDDLPRLIWHKNWDNTNIHCDVPLLGGGARNYCFKMSDEAGSVGAATTRPGVEFIGAPLISIDKPTVVPPTDYYYGFWFDGVDDSIIRLRLENTGDTDVVTSIFVGDDTGIYLGSGVPGDPLVTTNARMYVDGPSSLNLRFAPLLGQENYTHPDLYFGSPLAGYYDQGVGQQTTAALVLNGCGYGTATADVCDGVTVSNMNNFIDVEGIPRDFAISGHTGKAEYHSDSVGATNTPFYQLGPASTNCKHCTTVRLHGNATMVGSALTADAFTVSGLIDTVQNDGITSSTLSFYRFTVMQLDGYLGGTGDTPFNLGSVGSHIGPGLIAVTGSPVYEWYIDGNGAVAADTCMRKRGSPAQTALACTDPETFFENNQGRSFLGRVRLELLEAVPSNLTQCTIAVEIAGGATAVGEGDPSGNKTFRYGGKDVWGRNLRAAGDWTQWALNDAVTVGQNITAEIRPVTGGTDCTTGAGCTCDGLNAFKVTVDELPALYDQ